MRIIAGELGGRRIQAPPGSATRPMLDRVREAMFSTLTPDVPEARVLDLFAGTGSLGLEALSRGAAEACFVERDRRAAKLLAGNVDLLDLAARSTVVRGDALAPESWQPGPWDLVFLDPPYPVVRDPRGVEEVLAVVEGLGAGALAGDGVCVLHAPRGLLRPAQFPAAFRVRLREYGSQALWYLRPDVDGSALPGEDSGEEAEPGA